MRNGEQKMVMCYGVMLSALQDIVSMQTSDPRDGKQLCDAISIAKKALEFVNKTR